jgi:hypothetical protein
MSFARSMEEAKSCIASVELSANQASSPIRDGASGPGGAASKAMPAGETLMPGRLRKGIKTPRTRTDTLTRKYGAS